MSRGTEPDSGLCAAEREAETEREAVGSRARSALSDCCLDSALAHCCLVSFSLGCRGYFFPTSRQVFRLVLGFVEVNHHCVNAPSVLQSVHNLEFSLITQSVTAKKLKC